MPTYNPTNLPQTLADLRGSFPYQQQNTSDEQVESDGGELILYCIFLVGTVSEIILSMRPANERWHYTVTPSLIG